MLTDRIEKTEKSNHVGATPDQWGKIAGKFTITAEFTKIGHDGLVSFQKHSVSKDFSLELPESGQARSHTHEVGGDVMVGNQELLEEIANKFYADKNIKVVYGQKEGNEFNLLLIIEEEVDQFALKLSILQKDIQKQYPGHEIDTMYIPKEHFIPDFIPAGATVVHRWR